MTNASDDFLQLLDRVTEALKLAQRISYRGLKRRFGLSDSDLEDIKDELIHARRVAADEDGTVLVWLESAAGDGQQPAVRTTGLQAAMPRYPGEPVPAPRVPLDAEKKQVTILFCDVANSMVLAERLGPEGWHETMNAFFVALTEAIHALKGTVNQFTGDGLLALFGAPVAHEDHALHACMAAMRIQKAVGVLHEKLKADHGLSLQLRIGLNSGEVVMGTIGDALRNDYTAQGHVVGIAARLENMADPGSVLLSEFCHRQIAGACEVKSRGRHLLKGLSAPIEVFELLSVRPDASRFAAARRRGLSRFVGRSQELAFLGQMLEAAQDGGGGRVVGLVAEPGMGKSRLLYEFQENCRARGYTVLTGQALSHGTNIPYLPMLQIFRSYYGISENETPESARAKIAARFTRMGPEYEEAAPLVQELLGVASPDSPTANIDPDAKQRRLLELLKRVVQGADVAGGSVLACIEDLHWLDHGSERFIKQWVDALPGSRRLLIVTFRPGYRAEWMDQPWYHELSLGPLSPASVKDLLVALIGDDPSTAGLADNILQKTGGNPFFCEEIVQSLRQSGQLSLVPGMYRLHMPIRDLQIPPSVQSLLAARIDRLSDDEKTLLQVAAVIGRDFSSTLLAHVSELQREDVASALLALKDAEFVLEQRPGASNDHTFRHALTQEVALQSLLRDKRRRLHARVAQGIEALQPERANEVASLLAYHWEQAGEPLIAAQAYGRAAVHIRSNDRAQQMDYIRKLLQLSQDLPPSAERIQLRLPALVEMIAGGAWRFSMSEGELDGICNEARQLAEAAGMRELALMIRSGRAAATGMMWGEIRDWHDAIAQLATEVDGASDEVVAAVRGQYSYALYASGELALGLEVALHSQALTGGDPRFGLAMGYSVLGAMQNCTALLRVGLGRMEEAFNTYRTAIEVLSAAGLTEELLWNMANQSESIYPLGLPPEHPWVQEIAANAFTAYERAEQVASDFTRGVAKRGRTVALLNLQRYADAEDAAIECLAHLRTRRAHLEVEARCLAFLAEAQLGVGKVHAAQASAREAVARSQEQGARYFECCAQLCLARTLAGDRDRIEEAEAALSRALALAQAVGSRTLVPQIVEQQSRLQRLRGREAESRAGFLDALRLYRDVHADGHSQRLERALADA